MYLTLEHLTKTFPARAREGEVTAVDDVSLGSAPGEFVTMILSRSPGVQAGEERRVGSSEPIPTAGAASIKLLYRLQINCYVVFPA